MQMYRWMYRAMVKQGEEQLFRTALEHGFTGGEKSLTECGVLTCSVFHYDGMLFVYVEAARENFIWTWPDDCKPLLQVWPDRDGVRWSIPMLDVFHDGKVSDLVLNRENQKVHLRIGSLAVLKPDMYSSYIFYHYQKQEEQPASFNLTSLVGVSETYLFSYYELPAIRTDLKQTGLLQSKNTPDNWHDVMQSHFITWQDVASNEKIWRKLETLFSF